MKKKHKIPSYIKEWQDELEREANYWNSIDSSKFMNELRRILKSSQKKGLMKKSKINIKEKYNKAVELGRSFAKDDTEFIWEQNRGPSVTHLDTVVREEE